MDELNLLRKKTGMTIAKAWMLMIICVTVLFLGGGILGVMASMNKVEPETYLDRGIFLIMLLIISISSIWGYFINKKKSPLFHKTSLLIYLLCLFIALSWSYISPLVLDFLPFNTIEAESLERVEIELLLGIALSLLFTILQIGVIGHGLLKNYLFKQVIFTVVAVSIVMVIPQAVIGLIFQTAIMFYIYYRTASFQLPLLMTLSFSLVEYACKLTWGHAITTQNYIRIHFVPNPVLYQIGLLVAVLIIVIGLYFIRKNTNPIVWQRPEEDEDLAFL